MPATERPVSIDRVRGMMLGLAIGDALGNTTESLPPPYRQRHCGEIRDYRPNRFAEDAAVGLPSDDTQLAYWTLEQILADGRIDPQALAELFSSRQLFGAGSTLRRFIRNFRSGKRWHEAAVESAGNGALMRIAPVLLPHLAQPQAALWIDTILCAALTHNHPSSIGACVAFIAIYWHLLSMDRVPDSDWWPATYIAHAKGIEGDATLRPRGGRFHGIFEGPIWRFVEETVPPAYRAGKDALTACEESYSGAFLLETVPCALSILMRHADDPEQAIVRAVNDTRDNDTIAAIVGAAVGALHGEVALPKAWREGLLGRTGAKDDGRVFELLRQADAFIDPTPGSR